MKILWWIIQGIVSMGSLILTYLPVVKVLVNKETEQILGIDWQWWFLIGLTIFVITIVSVIIRLVLENRYLHSKEYKQRTEKEELELEKLRLEKQGREHPTLI